MNRELTIIGVAISGLLIMLLLLCINKSNQKVRYKIETIGCKQQVEEPMNDIIIIDGIVMVIPRNER